MGVGTRVIPNVEALRPAREKKGISLGTFAKKLGFSAAYLSDIERGRRACTPQIFYAYEALTKKEV